MSRVVVGIISFVVGFAAGAARGEPLCQPQKWDERSAYYPYLCREDAIEEYRSLRNEIVEAQKQRMLALQISIPVILGAFVFFMQGDRGPGLDSGEALMIVALTIAPSLFSYSTRCREQRIADYIGVFLRALSPWSWQYPGKPRLNFFQRTSTAIVGMMVSIDVVALWQAGCLAALWRGLGTLWQAGFSVSRLFAVEYDARCLLALVLLSMNLAILSATSRLPRVTGRWQAALKHSSTAILREDAGA